MRRFVVWSSVMVLSSPALAQFPPPAQPPTLGQFPPSRPVVPTPGGQMPGGQSPGQSPRLLPSDVIDLTKNPATAEADLSIVPPLKEQLTRLDVATLQVLRSADSWQLYAGTKSLADFGKSQIDADEARRILRELRPTEWAGVGARRVVVSYGLTGGKAALAAPRGKSVQAIDLKSVRAEQVRGAWVLKDDVSMLLNFGAAQADAEQAVAVARKYGFNRLGHVGSPAPALSYFYAAAPEAVAGGRGPDLPAALAQMAAEQNMARTGIAVPGAGFAGEQVRFDPRKAEVRKERGAYNVVSGPEVLGRFGGSEWAARDALKVIQDGRFTEYCRLGDVTFFLTNGQAPARVPYNVVGRRFDPGQVKARSIDGRYGIFEGTGRQLFSAATADEAEQIVRLIQGFGFDTACQVGLSASNSLKFLAKTGGR